jgi:hypothetical protein
VFSRPSDVARRLGISRVAVYKAIRAGRFAAVRVFCGSGPLRVFTAKNGLPLPAAPASAGAGVFRKVVDLAQALDVSPTLVRRACVAGVVAVWQTPGGQYRIFVDKGTSLPLPPRVSVPRLTKRTRSTNTSRSRKKRKRS